MIGFLRGCFQRETEDFYKINLVVNCWIIFKISIVITGIIRSFASSSWKMIPNQVMSRNTIWFEEIDPDSWAELSLKITCEDLWTMLHEYIFISNTLKCAPQLPVWRHMSIQKPKKASWFFLTTGKIMFLKGCLRIFSRYSVSLPYSRSNMDEKKNDSRKSGLKFEGKNFSQDIESAVNKTIRAGKILCISRTILKTTDVSWISRR